MVAQLYFALHGVNVCMTALFTIIRNDFILVCWCQFDIYCQWKLLSKPHEEYKALLWIACVAIILNLRNLWFKSKFNWLAFTLDPFAHTWWLSHWRHIWQFIWLINEVQLAQLQRAVYMECTLDVCRKCEARLKKKVNLEEALSKSLKEICGLCFLEGGRIWNLAIHNHQLHL